MDILNQYARCASADLYVGLRSERYFVQQGERSSYNQSLTDIDGKLMPVVPLRCARCCSIGDTERKWQQEETNAEDCTIKYWCRCC